MVREGYLEGELNNETPNFKGYWKIEIQDDDQPEEIRNAEIAKKIMYGNTSGYYPTYSWQANIF